ncbi:MAG TPA: hypothetical protein VFQ87_13765, partial [Bradyrhizobium sp.]|nr:hypothetical protein [Bradyrhizobium sp.]
MHRLAQFPGRRHDPRRRLRQRKFVKQAAEASLAVGHAIMFEVRQCEAGASLQPAAHTRKQKSLLVNRQQHIEL